MAELNTNSTFGPYIIERSLPVGRGGMARVYIARLSQNGTGRLLRVALKVAIAAGKDVPSEKATIYADALVNEVEILKGLRHPNIVKLHKIPWGTPRDPYIARAKGIEGEPWFFAMEYLAGGSLKQLLDRKTRLAVPDALEIADQIGLALNYAHASNIAHLDIKPDNILFRENLKEDGNYEAVLVDWGISAHVRKLGIEAGTVPYMPPERVLERRGEQVSETTDRRPADVYALGILLYRMLTGQLPFQDKDPSKLESAILNSAPTNPRQLNNTIPLGVQTLILDTLEKDPRRRLKIHEFNDRITDLIRNYEADGQVDEPRDIKPIPSGGQRGGSRWWVWLGLLLLLLVGGGFLAMNTTGLFAALTQTPTATPSSTLNSVPILQTLPPTNTVPHPTATGTRPLGNTATLIPSPTGTPQATLTPLPSDTNTRVPTPIFTRTPSATFTPTVPEISATPVPSSTERRVKPPTSEPPKPTNKPQPTDKPQPTPKPTKKPPTPQP